MVAGIEVYGGIKNVSGTKIATTFLMIMYLPVIPGNSMYYLGQGEQHGAILPVVGGFMQQEILGVLCSRINWLSVVVAYLRAYGTVLIIAGASGLLGLFMFSLSPNSGNPFETPLPVVLGALIPTGSLVVAGTYLIGSRISPEEARIRAICAEVFGVAADPADVRPETASAWERMLREQLAEIGAEESLCKLEDCPRLSPDIARLYLLLARAQLAIGASQEDAESLTRAILDRLAICDQKRTIGHDRAVNSTSSDNGSLEISASVTSSRAP